MPNYDLKCLNDHIQRDELQPITYTQEPCPVCGAAVQRVTLPGRANGVSGDECDVVVKHGLCNADGSPRRYRSKSEMTKEAKRRGMENYVRHVGTKGGDRSKHTTRWI